MNKLALITGSAFCGISVALGAFGAHALSDMVTPDRLDTWDTAARYLSTQGLGLIFTGLLAFLLKHPLKLPTGLLISGGLIFSTSLFLLVLLNISWLGAVAPVGGLLMIAGWCALIVSIIKHT
jgi:uncharacterized membrane protein YgdD (TMEM256/DUF423 family)